MNQDKPSQPECQRVAVRSMRSFGLYFCCDAFDEEMMAFVPRLADAKSKEEFMAIMEEAKSKDDQRKRECPQPCSDLQDRGMPESHPEDFGWNDYLMIQYTDQGERDCVGASRKKKIEGPNNPSSDPACESK